MKDNEAMQESGVEWIGAIPQGWKVKIIKREFDIKLGKMLQPLQKTELDTEEYYLKTSNIYWEGVDVTNINKMWFSSLDKQNTELQYNDLLVCEGGDVGRSALWKEEITPCYIQNAINRVRPIHHCSTKYLYYWLFLMKHSGYIDAMVTRITIAHLTAEKLERLVFLLPPHFEQQAIAHYLDQQCGKLDAIIAIKQQQIKALDALRQSIIYHAVTKGLNDSAPLVDSGVEWLGKIPQSWRVSKLKYITNQIVDGTHFTPNYVESGVPFLRVTDIQTQAINLERIKFITEEEHTELTKRAKPQKGDVLLSKNGTIGITKVVDWDWEFSIFVSLCLIKFLPNINPYYFSYFFESDVVNQQLFESSKKTSVTNLHLVKIRELLLCVPPFPEQQRIIDHLDQETQLLAALKANLNQQISTLEDYKKSLIYECMTGKKRIKADA